MGGTMHLEQEQLNQVYEKLLRFGNEAGKTVSQALHDSVEVIQGEIHGCCLSRGGAGRRNGWPPAPLRRVSCSERISATCS